MLGYIPLAVDSLQPSRSPPPLPLSQLKGFARLGLVGIRGVVGTAISVALIEVLRLMFGGGKKGGGGPRTEIF